MSQAPSSIGSDLGPAALLTQLLETDGPIEVAGLLMARFAAARHIKPLIEEIQALHDATVTMAGPANVRMAIEDFLEFLCKGQREPSSPRRALTADYRLLADPVLEALRSFYDDMIDIFYGDDASLAARDQTRVSGRYLFGRSPLGTLARYTHCMALSARLRLGTLHRDALIAELREEAAATEQTAAAIPPLRHYATLALARMREAQGDPWGALQQYDRAITMAKEDRRLLRLGLALEESARYQLSQGLLTAAPAMLRAAAESYLRFGAYAKFRQLCHTFPQIVGVNPIDTSPSRTTVRTEFPTTPSSRLRAPTPVLPPFESEVDLGALTRSIIDLVKPLSKADSVALLVDDTNDGWLLVGGRREGQDVSDIPRPGVSCHELGFPQTFIQRALSHPGLEALADLRSEQRQEASASGLSPTVTSALIVPVLTGPALGAILLLGRDATSEQFTLSDLDAVNAIAGPLGKPIETAWNYRRLEKRVAQRTKELETSASQLLMRERALECSAVAVLICRQQEDDQLCIVYVNPTFESMTGYKREEVLMRDPFFLRKQTNPREVISQLRHAVRERRECKGVILLSERKDGTSFYAETSVTPVPATPGALPHAVVVMHDVTDRVRAEEVERQRNERLRAVFDLSPDGFVVLDQQGLVSIVNPAFERLTGFAAASLIGQTGERFESLLNERIDRSGVDAAAPYRPRARPGEIQLSWPVRRVLQRQTVRSRDAQGETVLYFRDITQETEIDRMKSDLLATAAHQLRTPMTSILGFSELLLERETGEAARQEMLGVIHRQTKALTDLINDLLDLARIEAGRGADFRMVLQPLRPIIESAASTVVDRSPVVIQGFESPDWVRASEARLTHAITNLLSNAFKYSSRGRVLIAEQRRIRREREEIGIAVVDQGIGMTQEQLGLFFERFFRADTSGQVPGTGLGTTIAKEIVERHGGELTAESTLHVGTTVTIWLPIHVASGDDPAEAQGQG